MCDRLTLLTINIPKITGNNNVPVIHIPVYLKSTKP